MRRNWTILIIISFSVVGALYLLKKPIFHAIELRALNSIEEALGGEMSYTSFARAGNVITIQELSFSSKSLSLESPQALVQFSLFDNNQLAPTLQELAFSDLAIELKKPEQTPHKETFTAKTNRYISNYSEMDALKTFAILNSSAIPNITAEKGQIQLSSGVVLGFKDFTIVRNKKENSLTGFLTTTGDSALPNSLISAKLYPALKGKLELSGSINGELFGSRWFVSNLVAKADWSPDGRLNLSAFVNAGDFTGNIKATALLAETNFPYDFSFTTENINLTPNNSINSIIYGPEFYTVAGKGIEGFMKEFSPNGLMDISGKGFGTLVSKPKLKGTIHLHDMQGQYIRIKYPLEAEGDITFNSERYDVDLICHHGLYKFDVTGWHGMRPTDLPDMPNCDLLVKSEKLAIDNNLYNSLSDNIKTIWLALAPSGEMGLNYHYTRNENGRHYNIGLLLDNAGICYRDFPYNAQNIKGNVNITREKITLDSITATLGEANASIAGEIENDIMNSPDYNLEIQTENLILDSIFADCLPPKAASFLDDFFLDVSADAVIKAGKQSGKLTYSVDANIRGNEIAYKPQLLEFKNPRLNLKISDSKWELNNATAILSGSEFTANATGKITDNQIDDSTVHIAGKSVDLLALLKNFTTPAENYISGPVELVAEAKIQNSTYTIESDVRLSNNSLSLNNQKFTGVSGVARYKSNGKKQFVQFNLDGSYSPINDSKISTNGTVSLANGKYLGNLTMDAKNIAIDKADFFRPLLSGGMASLHVDDVNFASEQAYIGFENAKLTFDNTSSNAVPQFTVASGDIICSGRLGKDLKPEIITGNLNCKDVSIYKAKITDIQYPFSYKYGTISSPTRGTSKLYDGNGLFDYSQNRPEGKAAAYSFNIELSNLNADKLISDITGEASDSSSFKMNGKLTSLFAIEGVQGRQEYRKGKLDINIDNGTISNRHIITKILSSIFSDKTSRSEVKNAQIKGYILRDKYIIENITFQFKDAKLQGAGQMSLGTQELSIKMNVYAFEDDKLRGKLLNAISKLIAEVNISGTLSSPVIKTKMLGFSK